MKLIAACAETAVIKMLMHPYSTEKKHNIDFFSCEKNKIHRFINLKIKLHKKYFKHEWKYACVKQKIN